MKAETQRAYRFMQRLSGLDPAGVVRKLRNLPRFLRTLSQYRVARDVGPFPLSALYLHPVLDDFEAAAGDATGHYFFQDLWAARRIFARKPHVHIDIGSRIDGFIAHLLTFMPVTVLDVRPLASNVQGLSFVRADATSMAEFADDSIESLSSLHAIEHFGLGRYGDAVDPDGWRKAMVSLQRVLRPGGRLYLSVPVGRERLYFNAHRVFCPGRVTDTLHGLELVSFSGVDDSGRYRDDLTPDQFNDQAYACGLYEFTKSGTNRSQ
jgi:SAM-dependent methyltransferase